MTVLSIVGLLCLSFIGSQSHPQIKSSNANDSYEDVINVHFSSFSLSDYRRKPTNHKANIESRQQPAMPAPADVEMLQPEMTFPEKHPQLHSGKVTKIPSCAKNGMYCIKDPEYPREYLDTLVFLDYIQKNNLYTVDPAPEVDLTQRIHPTDEQPLCLSHEDFISPERLETLHGQWPFVVQAADLTQTIRVERCMQENQPCKLFDNTANFKTMCHQKYIIRKLMALPESKSGVPVPEDFKIPSCCACMVSTDISVLIKRQVPPTTRAPRLGRNVKKRSNRKSRQANRKPLGGGSMVFPDKTAPAKIPFRINVSLEGADCVGSICDSVKGYPKEYLDELASLNAIEDTSLFGADVPPEVDLSTRFDSGSEVDLCQAEMVTKFPEAILRQGDEYPTVIVNNEKYLQGITMYTCSKSGSECKFSDRLMGYKTTCVQKYVKRKLMAVSPEGKVYPDFFDIPACCVCQVIAADSSSM